MSTKNPICIIPARAGSKGLQNKNMLFLCGKPLIIHTIDAIVESQIFKNEDIYVSTDSMEYKKIIEMFSPIKVILRSSKLSSDKATTFEVLKDFLKGFEDDTEFILCQPTSPLRNSEVLKECYKLFKSKDYDSVVTFTETDKGPRLLSTIDSNGFAKDIVGIDKGYTRQNQQKYYYPNGAVYISTKKKYIKNESFFTEKTFSYVMSKQDSIDIDDKYDFINVLGLKYFNYLLREKENKDIYYDRYKEFANKKLFKNVLIGDSRLEQIDVSGYSNISIGGITLHTVCENIDEILNCSINKVFIAVGVNDIRVKYSLNSIKNRFEELVEKLITNNIEVYLSTIIYTLFRYEINNEDILEINEFIIELAKRKSIKIIDVNRIMSNKCKLNIQFTKDGLHLNEVGNKLLSEFYNEEL